MEETLDSNSAIDSLPHLVEEYVLRKRNRHRVDLPNFEARLHELGYSSDQIDYLLIEMDDDADKELLAGDGSKRAKQKLIISLFIGLLGMTLSIAGAAGTFGMVTSGWLIIPFGIIGTAFVVAGKAYTEIGLVKKRRKRRFLKYQNWKK